MQSDFYTIKMMVTTHDNTDYKTSLDKALVLIEAQQLTIQTLQLELLQLKKWMFGNRHEKFITATDPKALVLFDVPPIAEVITTQSTTVTYEKTNKQIQPGHKGRPGWPASLRREEQIFYPEGIDLAKAKKIGEDFTETLAYKPGELFVKRKVRPKYLDEATNRILQAPAPNRAFEKSNVDASLVAQMITDKYIDHLPLYRQLKRYSRLGVIISDSTSGDWVAAAAKIIMPLYEAHKQLILGCHYLYADETTIKVLESERKNSTHLGYYWVYQSQEQNLVLFDYQTGRGREGPRHILNEYQGYLQTDGYGVYEQFADKPGITLLCCLAHARRKFSEGQSNNKDIASHVLTEIQKLYAIERQLTDNVITGDQKLRYRAENAMPILKELGIWMKEKYMQVLPRSAIGKALAYSLKRWDKLSLYATTSECNIDNNPVENSIRSVALGRKNYLFAGSHEAAQRAAMFYSLLATCKNHLINPYDWLHDVLNRIANHPQKGIEELLPQNWKPNTTG